MSAEQIARILHAFDAPPDNYQRVAVEEAVTIRDEITPWLLAILDELATEPEKFNDEHTLLHMYAASLLAHFKEPKAHQPIIRAFNLPPKVEYGLWAEMTTELLPVLLFQTCGGKVDAIKELVVDKSANEMVRASAMDALTLAALRGVAQREDVLTFFGGLFIGTEADRSSNLFWSSLASAATDLWPKEILPAIKKAYDDGLASEVSIGWDDIEESVAEPMSDWLDRERDRAERKIPSDVHGYMSWLACFEPTEPKGRSGQNETRLSRAERDKRKARKKIAKKSRKRNQR